MADSSMSSTFPPPLLVGARVWTADGYREHGPIEGPKVDIPANPGGTVETTSKPYSTMDQLLYMVRWDNGQTSKHYAKGLFCIGRFKTFEEFKAAIVPQGPVQLTLGPQGGFREARFSVKYDGRTQEAALLQGDRELWINCVEPIVKERRVKISETRLPSARKKKRSS